MEYQHEYSPEPTVSEQLIDLHILASEPPLHTSPTYSESLSRIQSGYLHCISVLEAHNEALQRDVREARARPVEMRGQIVQLETTLAVKNKALVEKNRKIVELEGLVKQLSQVLDAAKKESVSSAESGGSGEGSRKLSAAQGKRKWGELGKGTAEDPWAL